MEDVFLSAVNVLTTISEAAGVVTIAVSIALAAFPYLRSLFPGAPRPEIDQVSLTLGRGLVLGLEFLIAADVLKTIIGTSLEQVAALAAVIILRTILSLSIQYELNHLGEHRQLGLQAQDQDEKDSDAAEKPS